MPVHNDELTMCMLDVILFLNPLPPPPLSRTEKYENDESGFINNNYPLVIPMGSSYLKLMIAAATIITWTTRNIDRMNSATRWHRNLYLDLQLTSSGNDKDKEWQLTKLV